MQNAKLLEPAVGYYKLRRKYKLVLNAKCRMQNAKLLEPAVGYYKLRRKYKLVLNAKCKMQNAKLSERYALILSFADLQILVRGFAY